MTTKTLSLAFAAGALAANISLAQAAAGFPLHSGHAPRGHVVLVSDTGGHGSHDKMDMHVRKAGTLEIVDPHMRATLPNAPVSGGYLTIRNTGSEADRLIGGSVDFAGDVEVHEMTMDGEVMKMRELVDGLEIPAGGEVVLKPGGYHLMFTKLGERMKDGETRKVTLQFEKTGAVVLEFSVRKIGGGHSGHGNHGGHDN